MSPTFAARQIGDGGRRMAGAG